MTLPHVVILGGGFGGLAAARALRRAPVRVTLIDRSNHHVFQPLLYQVATAGLEASDVGHPLRTALRRQRNTDVLMAEAEAIDPDARTVTLARGGALAYDYLIVATGALPAYFCHREWAPHAPGLKNIADAIEMRHRVLEAFELAEQTSDPSERDAYLRFVVVGGGATGVELAGALAELARFALRRDYHHIQTACAKIVLLQGGAAILPGHPAKLQRRAEEQLGKLGVEVRTSARVSSIDERGVTVGDERIIARTVLWAAGVRPTPIVHSLGVPLDRRGRVPVDRQLNPQGLPDVYVIGDLAALEHNGKPIPGVAPAAMQQGRHAARAIAQRLRGRSIAPFRYRDKGQLAVIGRSRAVGVLRGGFAISGLLAWLAYSLVHLFYLAGIRNRASALLCWAWSYLTYARGARLIPSDDPDRRADARATATAFNFNPRPADPHTWH